ncbi:MAG: DNA repair protein RadC [Actinomycetota bacterium]
MPPHERPRERLMARGVEALSERELLALVLRSGRQGESALDLAATLLAQQGGLAALAGLRPEELAGIPGVGSAKAAALVAAFRLGRVAEPAPNGPVLRSAEDVAGIAVRELVGARRERVIVLVCDGRNRLRRVVPVSEGAIDRSIMPVREILNAVLRLDGRSFAVAHSHPSGDPTASAEDTLATHRIREASSSTGLRFLGHVIVAGSQWRRA